MGGIPSHYSVDLDLVSPVELAGIPTGFRIDIASLPRIEIKMDPITINPVDVSVRVKEIPSVRAHIPAAFTLGFSVLGLPLASVRLCGEAQIINEPYVPNPCEHCGSGMAIPNSPLPVSDIAVDVPQRKRKKGK